MGTAERDPIGLLNFTIFALTKYSEPALTHRALESAMYEALMQPDGVALADLSGLPTPDWDASLPETVGAFGDWLRLEGMVEACGFSRAGTKLKCEFRGCGCEAVVRALYNPTDREPVPCAVLAFFGALLRARGVVVGVESYELSDDACTWILELGSGVEAGQLLKRRERA